MSKRTNWDFSNYTHKIEIFKSDDGNEIRIDHLRNGSSSMGYVRFVNDDYGLTVFGDFGNWVFCRPFVPSKDGYVCEYYWNEKLKIGSTQEHSKYNAEETENEINELIESGLEEKGYYGDELESLKEWFTDLLTVVDDELEYTYHALRTHSNIHLDYEYIPFVKTGSKQLEIIFDAFDEICSRLK